MTQSELLIHFIILTGMTAVQRNDSHNIDFNITSINSITLFMNIFKVYQPLELNALNGVMGV